MEKQPSTLRDFFQDENLKFEPVDIVELMKAIDKRTQCLAEQIELMFLMIAEIKITVNDIEDEIKGFQFFE